MTFTAPAKSIQFLLNHSVDLDSILSLPAFSDVNRELIGDILTGAADFAENVWAPTNWDGDQNPATLNGDDVPILAAWVCRNWLKPEQMKCSMRQIWRWASVRC